MNLPSTRFLTIQMGHFHWLLSTWLIAINMASPRVFLGCLFWAVFFFKRYSYIIYLFLLSIKSLVFWASCSKSWPNSFWSSGSFQRLVPLYFTPSRFLKHFPLLVILHPTLCKTVPMSILTTLLYVSLIKLPIHSRLSLTYFSLPYHHKYHISSSTLLLIFGLFALQISSTLNLKALGSLFWVIFHSLWFPTVLVGKFTLIKASTFIFKL